MTYTHRGLDGGVNGIKEHTVGVLRCVLDRTISKKSAAVGTGAIALRLLVDMVSPCTGCRVGRVAKKYRDVTSRVTPVTYYYYTSTSHCQALKIIFSQTKLGNGDPSFTYLRNEKPRTAT